MELFKGIVALIGILTTSSAYANEGPQTQTYPEVIVYEAGTIITMEPGYPEAKFVAVSEGTILAIAQSIDELGAWTNGREATIDRRFWQAGWSLHTHINGDKGLDVVLGIAERMEHSPGQDFVLEHLGYSTEAQNRRIGRLGLFVSAQPNYIRVLGDAYSEAGLGPDRAAQMSRLGSLERKDVPLGLHSDFNMAPIDPLYLAWVASNRVTLSGNSKAPAERLSLDKALRAITIEAAQIIGMDDAVGSIAAGKKADFVVLDRDPRLAGAPSLRDVEVNGVIFEGHGFPTP